MRIATLPWYDLHEVRDAHDRLWSAIAAQLRTVGVAAVPETLDRTRRYDAGWHEPELLLGQACGYDTVLEQPPPLRIVATPHFDFAGCDGPNYRSFVVVPARSHAHTLLDLRGKRCVINNATSHSGMNGLRAMVAPLQERGFFSRASWSAEPTKRASRCLAGARRTSRQSTA